MSSDRRAREFLGCFVASCLVLILTFAAAVLLAGIGLTGKIFGWW